MRWRVLLVGLALLVAACAEGGDRTPSASRASDPPADPGEYVGSDAGFYDVPDPLPSGEPGDLIRWQRLDVDVEGLAWRVMYLSESVAGATIPVTGMVVAPLGEPPATGRPVLAWAHGTVGLGDQCAPSKDPESTIAGVTEPFLDRGWVIVGTDYEGLGTPGHHPWLAGVSEGRGVLDIVKAATQLDEAGAGRTTVIWGHSQGGHAALFANELAPTWAPQLDVVGAVAGAPPADLPFLTQLLRDGPYTAYIAMAAAGLNTAYPEADLDAVLTSDAVDRLPEAQEGCILEVHDAFAGLSYDELMAAELDTVASWRPVLAESEPGNVVADAPVLLVHGEADDEIPAVVSERLFGRLCRAGQVAERRTYPGAAHGNVVLASFLDVLRWLDDRVAGVPAVDGCPEA